MKTQLIHGIKSISSIYGETLYRIWNEVSVSTASSTGAASSSLLQLPPVSSPLQDKMEEQIQSFLSDAVHTANPKYFKGLRSLIKAFHDVKRSDSFECALIRIYDPILWRSLQCANCIVRSQTAILFFDVFPLQQLHTSSEQSDLYLQKQFNILTLLLKDNDHRVRSTTVIGVSHILKEYWDLLPLSTINNLLKFFFETLAFDTSNPCVRLSVIQGIQDILLQPLSHITLKGLIPLIKSLLCDKCEKVRGSFIKLLLQVKTPLFSNSWFSLLISFVPSVFLCFLSRLPSFSFFSVTMLYRL
jgi:hypothetical protein